MYTTWILRPEYPQHLEVSYHTWAITRYLSTHGFITVFWMHLSAPSYIQLHHWFTLPPEYTLDSPCLSYAFPHFCHSQKSARHRQEYAVSKGARFETPSCLNLNFVLRTVGNSIFRTFSFREPKCHRTTVWKRVMARRLCSLHTSCWFLNT